MTEYLRKIMIKEKKLLKILANPSSEYRPVAFWFINHFLRQDEIRCQVREMAEKGFGGFMFHGRAGLRSKYLEDEWERGLRVAMEEAERFGLDVWLYDEYHYPSGMAGGKVFEKYPNRYMKYLIADKEIIVKSGETVVFTISKDVRYILCFPAEDKNSIKLQNLLSLVKKEKLKWTNHTSYPMQIIVLKEDISHPGPGSYFENYPDYLDPEIPQEFINLTHEWYRKKFGSKYGKLVKGIFTDNACANFGYIRRSIPWSRNWAQRFKNSTGCDIINILPGLFYRISDYRKSRLLFWRFLNDEFLKCFVTPILNHCKKNNIHSTGHYCLEDGLSEHVRQIGDRFQLKKNQSLCGVDQLGPEKGGFLLKGGILISGIKHTNSASALYGSPRVLCESFGLASGWDFDMQDLRRISGCLIALGVNLFVPHGLYYSIAGGRKHESIPDHFHNPMWKYYRLWTDWISRLCWLTTDSDSLAEVAVLHPTTTLQAYIEMGLPLSVKSEISDHGNICDKVDATFRNLMETMIRNHISFEILPEEALHRSVVEKLIMKVPARRQKSWKIKSLILPCIKVLEQKTFDVISSFVSNGGQVICIEETPESIYDVKLQKLIPLNVNTSLSGLITFNSTDSPYDYNDRLVNIIKDKAPQLLTIKGSKEEIISRIWEKEDCRFYLIHNCTVKFIDNLSLIFHDRYEPMLFDIDKVQFIKGSHISGPTSFSSKVNLSPAETKLWISGINIKPEHIFYRLSEKSDFSHSLEITKSWNFSTSSPNLFPLRNGQITYEKENYYRCDFKFFVKDLIPDLKLLVDVEMTRSELIHDGYNSDLHITLNGKTISSPLPGKLLDRWIFETDISHAVKLGENLLQIHRDNSFVFKGQMWNPYISGNFCLEEKNGKFILKLPPCKLSTGDCTIQGYPFYSGEYHYQQIINLPECCHGRSVWLDLGEIFNAVEVIINGKSIGKKILPPWRYEFLNVIKNKSFNLEIKIINTQQNLFGEKRVKSGLIGPVKILW